MKKVLLLVLVLLLALVACSTDEPEVVETPTEETAVVEEATEVPEVEAEPTEAAVEDVDADANVEGLESLRIAIVMPSTINDLAWSQALYDALLRLQEEAGGEEAIELAYSENMFNVTDAAAAIRDYAADDYDVVIAHGTQYGTSLFEIAPDFPETTFAYGTAVNTGMDVGLTNIFAYEARAEEGGYVNGVLAAELSESGIIGVVGPVEAGDAKLYIDGFVAGVMATNPDAQVNVSYTGSFGDTALAAEAANTHIAAGADVLTGSAQQVVGAISVAEEQGVVWMGTQSDQSSLAPDIVIASQLYDWDGILSDILQKNNAGEYGGSAYALTLANNGLVMDFADSVDADAVAVAEEAAAAIAAGDIDVMAVVNGEDMGMDDGHDDAMMEVDIEPIRIAIVMPSTINDLAWSQALYDSLLRIQEAAGGEDVVELAYSENMFNVTDAAAAIRDYAADEYTLVIAHGTQYGTSLFEIAPDFPETTFAYGTAVNTGVDEGLENIFAYEARAEEGGYVNGVLAAALSESGIIGVVGPVEAGDAKLYIDGFEAGVMATNPDAVVNISYTGSFGDTALAAEAANTHIAAGADVLTGSAQQVVGAVSVAEEQGVVWMGTQSDQSSLAPEIVVASQLYDWDAILLDIINKHQAGEYGGTAYAITLANGGLVMDFADLDADAIATAEAAIEAIIAGDIDILAE